LEVTGPGGTLESQITAGENERAYQSRRGDVRLHAQHVRLKGKGAGFRDKGAGLHPRENRVLQGETNHVPQRVPDGWLRSS